MPVSSELQSHHPDHHVSPGATTINAEITDDGGGEVSERGIVWSSVPEPSIDINDGIIYEGSGIGAFSSIVTGLTPNTRYYVRAYATNSEGTAYSEEKMFNFWDYHGKVTDFDGNVYNTVMIGSQEWMAENLKTTSYRNGIPITTGLTFPQWEANTSGAFAWYNNDIQWKDIYGALYNWHAAINPNGICPAGWHLPSDAEWTDLVNYVVSQGRPNEFNNPNGAGNALKSCRQVGSPLEGACNTSDHPRWESDATHYGTDVFGFSALPGGRRSTNGSFGNIGYFGFWWSATEGSTALAWRRSMYYYYGIVNRYYYNKATGFSVRCVRDN